MKIALSRGKIKGSYHPSRVGEGLGVRCFLFVAFCLLLPSCKEIGPDINLTNSNSAISDTTYIETTLDTPQQKAVLLEDFTGVQCKNCPTGANTAEGLLASNPGRMIVVAIHSGFLDSAYTGYPSLHNQTTNDLEAMLGPLVAKPSAAIDRVSFAGAVLQYQVNSWPGYVDQELALNTPVNVSVSCNYNSASNSLIATVRVAYTGTVTDDNRITVMVTEDSINAAQLMPSDSVNYSYFQDHVLRTTLTNDTGDPITVSTVPGRVIINQYQLSPVPSNWNVNNLNIVALVHDYVVSFKVWQAATVKVVQ